MTMPTPTSSRRTNLQENGRRLSTNSLSSHKVAVSAALPAKRPYITLDQHDNAEKEITTRIKKGNAEPAVIRARLAPDKNSRLCAMRSGSLVFDFESASEDLLERPEKNDDMNAKHFFMSGATATDKKTLNEGDSHVADNFIDRIHHKLAAASDHFEKDIIVIDSDTDEEEKMNDDAISNGGQNDRTVIENLSLSVYRNVTAKLKPLSNEKSTVSTANNKAHQFLPMLPKPPAEKDVEIVDVDLESKDSYYIPSSSSSSEHCSHEVEHAFVKNCTRNEHEMSENVQSFSASAAADNASKVDAKNIPEIRVTKESNSLSFGLPAHSVAKVPVPVQALLQPKQAQSKQLRSQDQQFEGQTSDASNMNIPNTRKEITGANTGMFVVQAVVVSEYEGIVELPKETKAGDSLLVKWVQHSEDNANNSHEDCSICSVPFFVPSTVSEVSGVVQEVPRRFIRIMAPGAPMPQITDAMVQHVMEESQFLSESGSRLGQERYPRRSKEKVGKEWLDSRVVHRKWSKFHKSSSRVGKSYQATVLPTPSHQGRNEIISNSVHVKNWEEDGIKAENDKIWDPLLAGLAVKKGENIDWFLKGLYTNQMFLGMEALHRSGYVVKNAQILFEKVITAHSTKIHGVKLTSQEVEIFNKTIMEASKNFKVVAEKVGKSVATCLVHYYRFYKQSAAYRDLKKRVVKNSDICAVCGDGGRLICCDCCVASYHMTCMDPPISELTEGDWFCPQCRLAEKEKHAKNAFYQSGSRVQLLDVVAPASLSKQNHSN